MPPPPTLRKRAPDGGWVRTAYRPEDYDAPADELRRLIAGCPYGTIEALETYDGAFQNYEVLCVALRDGARWALLRALGGSWLIWVEVADAPPARIEPVAPEWAWGYSRWLDGRATPPVPFEGAPPPGFPDPAADPSVIPEAWRTPYVPMGYRDWRQAPAAPGPRTTDDGPRD